MESCHPVETESGTLSLGLSPPRRSAEGLLSTGRGLGDGPKHHPRIGAPSASDYLLQIRREGDVPSKGVDDVLEQDRPPVIKAFADVWRPFAHVGRQTIHRRDLLP